MTRKFITVGKSDTICIQGEYHTYFQEKGQIYILKNLKGTLTDVLVILNMLLVRPKFNWS